MLAVTVKPDIRLFTAYALLNATGYNAENGWQYGAVRTAIRRRLAPRSDHWTSTLADWGVLDTLHRGCGAIAMDIVIRLGSIPSFGVAPDVPPYLTKWQTASLQHMQAVGPILREFYLEESINELWQAHAIEIDLYCDQLQAFGIYLDQVRACCWADGVDVIVMPNLLDIRGRGYSVSDDKTTWLFVGETEGRDEVRRLLIHELLHRVVDPLVEARCENSLDKRALQFARARYRIVAETYSEFPIWLGETIVRASTAFFERQVFGTSISDDQLLEYERMGFRGVSRAYALLASKSVSQFCAFLPDVMEVVLKEVNTRLSN